MEELLRRKLLADADGMGDDRRMINLSKMVLKFFQDVDGTVASNGNEISARKLVNLVQQCDIAMKKTTLTDKVTNEELSFYETLSKKIVADIAAAHQRINECKKDLQEAKQIRKQKQEYDSLAALIKKHRARTETYGRLEDLKQQVKAAAEKRNQCRQHLENRKKQLHVLLISLQELTALVKNDAMTT